MKKQIQFFGRYAFLVLIFVTILPPKNIAQKEKYENIIPNPGFEEYSTFPIGWFYTGRHFSRVQKYWFSATNTSPDVYGPKVVVPKQWQDKGFGNPKAAQGQSYVGITTYGCESEKPHCKEYIEVQLKEPLVPGQNYKITMDVTQLQNSMPVNNLGVVLSEERILHRNEECILIKPAVNFTKVIDSRHHWIKLQSKFVASDASQYLVIGNFFSDQQTKVLPAKYPFGYFYLDHVVLKKVPPILPVPIDKNDLQFVTLRPDKLITLHNIYFEFDKADLHPRSDKELQQLVAIMENDPMMEIEIIGHTDDMGTDNYNLILSQKRALAVKKYLVENNINESRLITTGKGNTEPMATNDTEAGRQKNRRIEFRILKMNKNAPTKISGTTTSGSGL
ncbi:MAG TPA: OmpA family protein [Saprospiraceae bacterium]|nr:OmpA family protein [Saprospiraceae bacterium]